MVKGPQKILIVEDDKNIFNLVKYNLEKAGYQCFVTITGEEALRALDKEKIDLIVLDIMLPKMNGFEVCKQIRQNEETAKIPIVMLTARGEEVDRVIGFELGADDYIVKPFSPRELVLRVKAIMRRGKDDNAFPKILHCGPIQIDIPRHEVKANDRPVQLTAMEFNLLVSLVKNKGRVQSREFLLEHVWDISAEITTRTIDSHVKSLRHKLGKCGKMIETVRGLGYKISDEDS